MVCCLPILIRMKCLFLHNVIRERVRKECFSLSGSIILFCDAHRNSIHSDRRCINYLTFDVQRGDLYMYVAFADII